MAQLENLFIFSKIVLLFSSISFLDVICIFLNSRSCYGELASHQRKWETIRTSAGSKSFAVGLLCGKKKKKKQLLVAKSFDIN